MDDLCWSPDGSHLACACYDHVIYVWVAETGKLSATLRGHFNEGFQLGFDPTGELLASHSWDSTTRLWNLVTGTLEVTAFGQGVQFSPDGTRLGFFQYGGLTTPHGIWELALASERRLLPAGDLGHERTETAVSPDDRLLACAGTNGILLWDAPSARRLGLIPLDRARCVAFAPSGQTLYTGSYKGVYEWPMRRSSGRLHIGPPRMFSDAGSVRSLTVSGDGRIAIACLWGEDRALVIPVDRRQEVFRLGPHRGMGGVATTADGRWVATATQNDFGVRVWDTASGALVVELPVKTTAWPEWSPDGSRLLVCTPDNYTVWRCDSWQEITRGSSSGLLGSEGSREAATRADPLRGSALRLLDPFSLEVLGDFVLPPGMYGRTRLAGASGWLSAASHLQPYVVLWDLRRVRAELAKLGLDWNAPPIPPLPASADDPVDVEVDLGSLGGT